MRISDWSSDVCSSDLNSGCRPGHASVSARDPLGPTRRRGPGAWPYWIPIPRVAAARLPHLTQTVIAGLVPAIHVRDRLLTSLEKLGAAAEWTLGTSPRVTTGAVGCLRSCGRRRRQ